MKGFTAQLSSVTLLPSSGGIFEVRAGGEVVFSKKEAGRFPEENEIPDVLKQKQLLE